MTPASLPTEITSARILVVEDSLGVARSLSLGLGLYRGGIFHVETCISGEEALEKLHENHFDLLVSDLRLPGMDGLTLLERARGASPNTRSILITAFSSAEVEHSAAQVANAFLPKPFLLQDLLRLSERVLREAAPGQTAAAARPPARAEVEFTRRKSVHFTVLACDFDGTLTDGEQIAPPVWEALRKARSSGMALILVTGRMLDSFPPEHPLSELCEAIVAENGSVIYFPRRDSVALPFGRVPNEILQHLEGLNLPLQRGMAIAASVTPHDEAIMRALRELRCGVTVEYNRESFMLLPPGATKGQGLQFALDELGYSPHNVIACGDGENDRSLFELSELGVAVANARPGLLRVADAVLSKSGGEGVTLLVNSLLKGETPAYRPRLTRRLLLGHRSSGSPVHLDPTRLVDSNTLIAGSSGSGKSWLAGLLAEELLKQKYQVCIIDPEGDYRRLGVSPRTLLLGGPDAPLPPVGDVLSIAEWNNVSLVLDLSMYSYEDSLAYLSDFMRMLRGLRARRGRPHYYIMDEVQNFCPPEGGPLTDLLLEAMQWGGFGLVSYRPSQMAPALLAAADHLLLTRLSLPEEVETLQPRLAAYPAGAEIVADLPNLGRGQAYFCTQPQKPALLAATPSVRFRVSGRVTPHVRHLHKYLRAPLPKGKRFYFSLPDGRGIGSAANLWEFREFLQRAPLDSLAYHLEREDFNRWVSGVLHDEELSRRLKRLGGRDLSGEPLRLALLELVGERYDELDMLV